MKNGTESLCARCVKSDVCLYSEHLEKLMERQEALLEEYDSGAPFVLANTIKCKSFVAQALIREGF